MIQGTFRPYLPRRRVDEQVRVRTVEAGRSAHCRIVRRSPSPRCRRSARGSRSHPRAFEGPRGLSPFESKGGAVASLVGRALSPRATRGNFLIRVLRLATLRPHPHLVGSVGLQPVIVTVVPSLPSTPVVEKSCRCSSCTARVAIDIAAPCSRAGARPPSGRGRFIRVIRWPSSSPDTTVGAAARRRLGHVVTVIVTFCAQVYVLVCGAGFAVIHRHRHRVAVGCHSDLIVQRGLRDELSGRRVDVERRRVVPSRL